MQGAQDWGLGAAEIPAAARRKEESVLWSARTALATTSHPSALPCRDAERATIKRFIEDAVMSGELRMRRPLIPLSLHNAMQTAHPHSRCDTLPAAQRISVFMRCILSRLEGRVQCAGGEDVGQCLYVYGVPGTGKTATVGSPVSLPATCCCSQLVSICCTKQRLTSNKISTVHTPRCSIMRNCLQVMDVMRDMRRRSTAGELPRFQFVEINGLRLPTPKHAYTALYEVSIPPRTILYTNIMLLCLQT